MGAGRMPGGGVWRSAVRAAVAWRGWRAIRVPLAVACLAGGLAGVGMPVWSGWWYAHVQGVKARAFDQELHAAAAPEASFTPPASASTAGESFAPLPPPPAPGASSLVPGSSGAAGGGTAAAGGAGRGPAGGTPAARDVQAGNPLADMSIPAIGVDSTVLEGLTYDPSVWSELLRDGPAHVQGSPLPGQPGNMVIFGHLNIWGAVFLHLSELQPGDMVDFTTTYGQFAYRVTGSTTISPTDLGAVAVSRTGPATVQLVTCEGVLDQQRLVVDATLVGRPAGGEA